MLYKILNYEMIFSVQILSSVRFSLKSEQATS